MKSQFHTSLHSAVVREARPDLDSPAVVREGSPDLDRPAVAREGNPDHPQQEKLDQILTVQQ